MVASVGNGGENSKVQYPAAFDVLAGKVIRLGHMGNNARVEKVADMLSAFTKALNDLGFSCRCDMKESFYRSL